jgi:hypothetical protein
MVIVSINAVAALLLIVLYLGRRTLIGRVVIEIGGILAWGTLGAILVSGLGVACDTLYWLGHFGEEPPVLLGPPGFLIGSIAGFFIAGVRLWNRKFGADRPSIESCL